MIEYVIFALFLLGFLAGGLYYLIKRRRQKSVVKWPVGTLVEARLGVYVAHLVHKDVSLEFTPAETAHRAALAAKCLADVLGPVVPRTFVVHVCDDATYDKLYDSRWGTKSNGMQLTFQNMPLLACRGSAFSSTPRTGSLVIHELLHASLPATEFNDVNDVKDYDHSDKRVWGGSPDSVEMKAQALFVKSV